MVGNRKLLYCKQHGDSGMVDSGMVDAISCFSHRTHAESTRRLRPSAPRHRRILSSTQPTLWCLPTPGVARTSGGRRCRPSIEPGARRGCSSKDIPEMSVGTCSTEPALMNAARGNRASIASAPKTRLLQTLSNTASRTETTST